MTDLAPIPGERRRSGGNHWHMPPAIERAKAARETKKPPPPAAATKPAPEVVTSLPPGAIYRIVTDLEALQDGFADRIADLDVAMTEVDEAGGLTRGNCQKLLVKSDAKWSRTLGLKSLEKMLRGTGLVLALIVDDARFDPIKSQMVKRKMKRP
jgi:hypothetical protein